MSKEVERLLFIIDAQRGMINAQNMYLAVLTGMVNAECSNVCKGALEDFQQLREKMQNAIDQYGSATKPTSLVR